MVHHDSEAPPTAHLDINPFYGETTFDLKVKDADGCSQTGSFNVYVDSLSIDTISIDTVGFCENNVPLTVAVNYCDSCTTAGDTTFTWSAATGLTNTNSATAILDATALSAGDYTYPVTVSTKYGCTATATAQVHVDTIEVRSLYADTITSGCYDVDLAVELIEGEGVGYQWSEGSNTLTADSIHTVSSFIADTTLTYLMTATDQYNCVDYDSIVMTIPATLQMTMPNDTVIGHCNDALTWGAEVEGGKPAYSFEWSVASGPSTIVNATDSALDINPFYGETTFDLKVKDADGCSQTGSFNVYVDSLSIDTISIDTVGFCENNVPLTVAVNYCDSCTTAGDTTFTWDPATGLTNTNSATAILDATALSAGDYTYPVTVSTKYGCTSTATAQVHVDTIEVRSLYADTITSGCYDVDLAVELIEGEGVGYQWSEGSNTLTADSIHTVSSFIADTTLTYLMTATDQYNCVDYDSIVMTIPATLQMTMPNDTVIGHCNDALTWGAEVEGGKPAYSFEWSVASGPSTIVKRHRQRIGYQPILRRDYLRSEGQRCRWL